MQLDPACSGRRKIMENGNKLPPPARVTRLPNDTDREQERLRLDEALDDALRDSFPASDPISLVQPQGGYAGWSEA
jgi:hypothetical protein